MSDDKNHAAPLVDVEAPYRLGTVIEPCQDCLPFSARVESHNGVLVITETHAIGCVEVTARGLCHGDLKPSEYCPFCGTYNPLEA